MDGYYEVYVDGNLSKIGTNINRDGRIEGNGNLVIGQEQVSFFLFYQRLHFKY